MEYIQAIVAVFRELRRVLQDDGTVWLNLGDFAGLVGAAWKVVFALVNDGWHLAQDVVWFKTSPMPDPGLVRCVRAHEYIFMLAKSSHYFYDHIAIQEASEAPGKPRKFRKAKDVAATKRNDNGRVYIPKDTRAKRSVWTISSVPLQVPSDLDIEHYAAFPPALAETCLLAGTSARGCCPKCRAPWKRDWEIISGGEMRRTATKGWLPTCDCTGNIPISCTVLDPFSGSGTTGIVALRRNCHYIGIDLNPDYERLAIYRIREGEKPLSDAPMIDPDSPLLGGF